MLNYIIFFSFINIFQLCQGKLQQVVSQFRHGARYPLNDFYDGNDTRQFWGQLTGVGMKQHQTYGKLLRTDYIDKLGFLSEHYQEGELQIYATDSNRTFQSARSQLYGLYPLGYGEQMARVDQQYHLPPFSNSTDSSQEIFSLPSGHRTVPIYIDQDINLSKCSNMEKEEMKNINSQLQTFKEMNLTYYPFMRKVTDIFNVSSSLANLWTMSSICGVLSCDMFLGKPFPDAFKQTDYDNILHLHLWFNFFRKTNNLSKAINTGKIRKVLKDFDDRIANPNNKTLKWTFISSHDTDEASMLQDLNISSYDCVEQMYRKGETTALNCRPYQSFASDIIFELHSNQNQQYVVQIRHEGQYVYLCEKKEISCPYQQWRNRVEKLIVDVRSICFAPQQS